MRRVKTWLAAAAVATLMGSTAAQAQWWAGTPYTGGPMGGGPWGYPYNYNGWNNNGWGRGTGNMNFSTNLGAWGNGWGNNGWGGPW
ncbi:hypothetical protein K9U33_20360, partial [Rhodoblastus acidophilus]|nr:hypothetical protein [Candidatus Rhodoblastus alkanivorans]